MLLVGSWCPLKSGSFGLRSFVQSGQFGSKERNEQTVTENVPEDEKVRNMTLKSAYEDLRQRTLERIPGTLGRLRYVAGLRSSTGYAHWGLERVHGTGAAQDAFEQVHKTLVRTVLRTRLNLLREDLGQSCEAERISPTSYASTLRGSLTQLLPAGCPKQTQLHLVSVLETLTTLAARRHAGSQSS